MDVIPIMPQYSVVWAAIQSFSYTDMQLIGQGYPLDMREV